MADRMGSYHGAFYLAGSAVILGAAIPFGLPFINKRTVHHGNEQGQALHPKSSKHQFTERNSPESDFACHDNPSFVGNLDTSYSVMEVNSEFLCNDGKKKFTGTSVAGVIDTASPWTTENRCSDNIKSIESETNPPLLLDDGTEPSETESSEVELISNKTQTRETLQSNTYQVEVEINSQSATTRNKDNGQEAPKENLNDTKF